MGFRRGQDAYYALPPFTLSKSTSPLLSGRLLLQWPYPVRIIVRYVLDVSDRAEQYHDLLNFSAKSPLDR